MGPFEGEKDLSLVLRVPYFANELCPRFKELLSRKSGRDIRTKTDIDQFKGVRVLYRIEETFVFADSRCFNVDHTC